MSATRSSRLPKLILTAAISALCGLMLASTPACADSGTVVYWYDALGRLTIVVYSADRTMTYTYDAAGNRTQAAVQYTYPSLTWSTTVATCTSNCWGSSTWGH